MSECKCTMAVSVTGDGCRYCQPQEYIDRLEEWLDDERQQLEQAQAWIAQLEKDNLHQRERRDAARDCIKKMSAENEQLRARVSQLELATLNAISFMPGGQAKADLRDAYDAEAPATAWLLRKQAEAVERLASHHSIKSMSGSYIWKEAAIEEATRLHRQADEIEESQ